MLSYPQLNAKGEANLPSFFLHHAGLLWRIGLPMYVPNRIASGHGAACHLSRRGSPAGTAGTAHAIRADSIETLPAVPVPVLPAADPETARRCPSSHGSDERAGPGQIVHRALERAHRDHRGVAEVFDEVFAEFCADAHVPEGYRTEAVRLELLYNLEMMESDERLTRGVTSLYEEPFSFELGEGATSREPSIVSKWMRKEMRR